MGLFACLPCDFRKSQIVALPGHSVINSCFKVFFFDCELSIKCFQNGLWQLYESNKKHKEQFNLIKLLFMF